MRIKVAVIGSRTYDNYEEFVEKLKQLGNLEDYDFISGGAIGTDTLIKRLSEERGLNLEEIKPTKEDYERFGRNGAPKERNKKIVRKSNWVVAFWDGQSGGTRGVIEDAKNLGKRVVIIKVPFVIKTKKKI